MRHRALDPRLVAITAIMTTVVFVVTSIQKIPTPVTGYIHLGDAPIFFAAFAFGPWVGGIAAALGTALADAALGYAQWAPSSFIVHGLEGVVAGLVTHFLFGAKSSSGQAEWYRLLLAAVLGSIVVVAGYYIAGTIMKGAAAAATEVPFNVIQVVAGALVGTPLFVAVRQAYPPLTQR